MVSKAESEAQSSTPETLPVVKIWRRSVEYLVKQSDSNQYIG